MAETRKRVPLFRKEVLEARSLNNEGSVLVPESKAFSFLTVLVLLFGMLLLLVLFLGRYSNQVVVPGWLTYVPVEPIVTSSAGGVVSRVWVKLDDTVLVGEPLFSVSAETVLPNRDRLVDVVSAQISDEMNSIDEQIELAATVGSLERSRQEQRLKSIRSKILSTQAIVELARDKVVISQQAYDRLQSSASGGGVSLAQLASSRDGLLSAKIAFADAQERIKDLRESQESLAVDIDLSRHRQQIRLSELEREKNLLEQKKLSLQQQGEFVVPAPISGVVTTLAVQVGQSVSPGESLASMRSENAQLTAQLLLPTRSTPFVSEGMSVALRYDAFPYQKYGQFTAEIQTVGSLIINPGATVYPVRSAEPSVVAIAEILASEVSLSGKTFDLRSGMTLTASIKQTEQSLVSWLVDSVLN